MLRFSFLACALIASTTWAARPMLIHQSQILEPPAGAGYYYYAYEVAIDGDWALVPAAPLAPLSAPQVHDALLYHRVNGQWVLHRTLARRTAPAGASGQFRGLAMNNGVAALDANPTRIFRRTNNIWAEITHPFTAPAGHPDAVSGTLVWDGNTLLAERHDCSFDQQRPWGALISRLNGNGSWSPIERLSSGDTHCNQEPVHWAISGNTVVAGTWTNDWEVANDQLRIFRRSGTSWTPTSAINGGDGEGDVRGDEIFFSSTGPRGTLVYRNDDSQTVVDQIRTVSAAYRDHGRAFGFTHTSDVFLQNRDVFRKNAAGKYEHVATLVPRGPFSMPDDAVINDRRVISPAWRNGDSGKQAALIFDLPATYTPSPVIASGFESGTSPFNPQLGAFAVARTPSGNRVYRQSSLAGEYRALLGNSDWEEQSIEADIKPTAFSGSDRWAGLAVRYLDAANYYYVALRSSGVIELKRMRNGAFTTVAAKPLPIVAGRNYHVALKAMGTLIRVYVDGQEFIAWGEEQPIPHGSAALLGYRTAVDYDNVVAAQVGQRPIYDQLVSDCHAGLENMPAWTSNGTGSWNCSTDIDTGVKTMQQTSTAGIARALVGTPTDDQMVTTRARATAFAANGQNHWFGLAARYRDESNYYYLTVRNGNTVSLSKLVNGAITVLGTASLTVTTNAWYDLRLDAVGNELRAFVNGVQLLQAVDSSHASGQGGILTYRARAEYTNYFAWQP